MRKLIVGVGAALGLAAVLAGCGSGSAPGQAAARQVHAKAARPDGLSPGMVSGVTPPGTGPSPVQVKFELQGRPDVGQPLEVDVVIVPVYGTVDRIVGKMFADEGLDIVSGQDIPVADKPVEGAPIHHSVRILPRRDGIFTLTAVLNVDATGQSTSQTYSIPVIAGAGLPDAPAGATHPAAAGQ